MTKTIISLAYIVVCAVSVQIQIPPVAQLEDMNIRLDEIQEIKEPSIEFKKVYRREVYEVSNDSIIPFGPCSESAPEVSFKNIGYYRLPYVNEQKIVYDFQTLKQNHQNVLDMFHHQQRIYTMSSEAELTVYRIDSNSVTGLELERSISLFNNSDEKQHRGRLLQEENKDEQIVRNDNTDDSDDVNEKQTVGDEVSDQGEGSTENTEESHEHKVDQEVTKSTAQDTQSATDSTVDQKETTENTASGTKNEKDEGNMGNTDQKVSESNEETVVQTDEEIEGQEGEKITEHNTEEEINEEIDQQITKETVQDSADRSDEQATDSAIEESINKKGEDASENSTQEGKQKDDQKSKGTTDETIEDDADKEQIPKENHAQKASDNKDQQATDENDHDTTANSDQEATDKNNQDANPLSEESAKSNDNDSDIDSTEDEDDSSSNPEKNSQSEPQSEEKQSNQTKDQSPKNNGNSKKNSSTADSQSTSTNHNLNLGYFVAIKNGTMLLFCNDVYVVALNLKSLKFYVFNESDGYQTMRNYQTVTSIDDDRFAVMDEKRGVFVYRIQDNPSNQSLKFELTNSLERDSFSDRDKSESSEMELIDMAYDQKRGILFCLDYSKGVLTFDVSIEPESQELRFRLSSYTILKKMCELMHYSPQSMDVYLVCNKVHRISTVQWPKIEERVFEHPLISVREIFVEEDEDIFVLAGYNVFKIMYLDRTTNYFQDDMLDRIIFKDGLAITANEKHIIALKYQIEKPSIVCQTSNQSLLGVHNLLLKTTAECNADYLEKVGYQPNRQITERDTCVYSIFQNAYLWQKGEVPVRPLSVVLLVFVIFLAVMFIWYVLVKFRMKRANYKLEALSAEGHKYLVEQDDGAGSYKGEQANSQNDNQTGQPPVESGTSISKSEDLNKDLYSIE